LLGILSDNVLADGSRPHPPDQGNAVTIEQDSASQSSAAPLSQSPHPPRRWLPWLAILITIFIFGCTLALLGYRWILTREPTSEVILNGGPQFAGVIVTVDGSGLAAPFITTLEEKNSFSAIFYLEAGSYKMQLKSPNGVHIIVPFLLPERNVVSFNLPERAPELATTQPATQASQP
jgi:hypothetical protein